MFTLADSWWTVRKQKNWQSDSQFDSAKRDQNVVVVVVVAKLAGRSTDRPLLNLLTAPKSSDWNQLSNNNNHTLPLCSFPSTFLHFLQDRAKEKETASAFRAQEAKEANKDIALKVNKQK